MAKRLTDTDLWDKGWFMDLPPKLKCLVKFVWAKCDLSGVWCPNWKLAQMYIGDVVNEAELLKIDNGGQFIKLESGKIFCADFINFQNGKLSDKSPIHIKILSMLKNHGIPYPYPIHRVSSRIIVGVEVKEEVIVEEEVEVKVGVPEIETFIEHCKEVLQEKFSEYEFSVRSKYQTWKDDGWMDGNGKKIKNWKNKINNTIPHLKPIRNGKQQTANYQSNLAGGAIEILQRGKTG